MPLRIHILTVLFCVDLTETNGFTKINLCGPSINEANSTSPVANETLSSESLIYFKGIEPENNICSCNIFSSQSFYISLKRLKLDTGQALPLYITSDNNTTHEDLQSWYQDPEWTSCLMKKTGNISKPFMPENCGMTLSNSQVTLETVTRIPENSYVYLYVVGEGGVNIQCSSSVTNNTERFCDTQNCTVCPPSWCNTNLSLCENTSTIEDDTTLIVNTNSIENTTADTSTPPANMTTTNATLITTPMKAEETNLKLAEQQVHNAQRMMRVSIAVIAVAVITFMASLFIFLLACRKHRYRIRHAVGKRTQSMRNQTKQEPPSYYDEVSDDLQIKATKGSSNDNLSTATRPQYDLAGGHSDTVSRTDVYTDVPTQNSPAQDGQYDVAKVMKLTQTSMAVENQSCDDGGEYNLATFNTQNDKRSMSMGENDAPKPCGDSAYNVATFTQPKQSDGLYDLTSDNTYEESAVSVGDKDGTIPGRSIHPTESDDGNFYSLQQFVTNDKPGQDSAPVERVMSHDMDVIEHEQEDTRKASVTSEAMDEELYANFSSIASEGADNNTDTHTPDKNQNHSQDENLRISETTGTNLAEGVNLKADKEVNQSREKDVERKRKKPEIKERKMITQERNIGQSDTSKEDLHLQDNLHPPKKTKPGYVNVTVNKKKPGVPDNQTAEGQEPQQTPVPVQTPAKVQAPAQATQDQAALTSPSADESDDDSVEDIYQNSEFTGSTVPLIQDTSDSEDIYANFQRGDGKTAPEPTKAPYVKNQESPYNRRKVVKSQPVVLRDSPENTLKSPPRFSQKKHQVSQSVDESASLSHDPALREAGALRKISEHKRARSYDSVGIREDLDEEEEEDVLVMVDNDLYYMSKGNVQPVAANKDAIDKDGIKLNLPEEDDDGLVMMENDIYEAFNCGGIEILPHAVNEEIKKRVKKVQKVESLKRENNYRGKTQKHNKKAC